MSFFRPIQRLALALLAASAVSTSGCSGEADNPRFLRIGLQDDFKSLDPAIGYSVSTWGVYHMLFDTLVTYDRDSRIIPDLAASWQVLDGGRTYVFKLRDDVKFHDGKPFTSADMVYSFERMLDPATRSSGTNFFAGIVGAKERLADKTKSVSGISAPDAHTLKIQLEAPNKVFLQLLAMPFASAVPKGMTSSQLARAPIGTGHFKFASWTPGQSVKLARYADYKGYKLPGGTTDAPAEGVQYVVGVSENLETLRFERGDIDLIGVNRSVPAADYAYLAEDPKWTPFMLKVPDAAFHYVGMNCRIAPFDKLAVRQAVAYAIDKKRMIQLINGRGEVAKGILPPPMPGYNKALTGIAFDPARATQLLASAGFPNGFSSTYYCTSSETEVKIAQAVQQDLAKVGIHVDIKPLAFPTFLDAKATPGRVAMAAGNWSQDFPDPSNFLTTMFASKNITAHDSLNDSYYSNPKVDAFLNAADVEPDDAKRLLDYDAAEQLIVADAPVVPLYYPAKVQFYAPRVTNYHLHPIWGVELDGVGVK